MTIRQLLRYLRPDAGVMTPREATSMGAHIGRLGGCGWIGLGPVVVLIDLPRRLQRPDPEPIDADVLLGHLNAELRAQD